MQTNDDQHHFVIGRAGDHREEGDTIWPKLTMERCEKDTLTLVLHVAENNKIRFRNDLPRGVLGPRTHSKHRRSVVSRRFSGFSGQL